MAKKEDKEPKSKTHTRATFNLPKKDLAALAEIQGKLRAQSRLNGRHPENMSEILEAALKAEIAKRQKLLAKP